MKRTLNSRMTRLLLETLPVWVPRIAGGNSLIPRVPRSLRWGPQLRNHQPFSMNLRGPHSTRVTCLVLVSTMLLLSDRLIAERPQASYPGDQAQRGRKLFIDPSSSSVAGGKAYLVVAPLIHQAESYRGDYQLKVRPYFFKSEEGVLQLAASEDSMRKFERGSATDFTGKVISAKGKTRVVTGTITLSTRDRGTVTFSVNTENGRMVFNTFYHFGP